MDLGAQFVNVQFIGNTKILMLKEGLICPSCQSELNLYYINELFRMSDALEEMADEYYGIEEVEDYCNREADATLELIAEKIAVIKLNRINTEGLASQSYSGVSESYIDGYPAEITAVLNRKRKIKVM